MNVFTIPAGVAFVETLARNVIGEADLEQDPFALADIAIFVPTRRSARALQDSFARIMGGAALLPQIRPLGDIDEDEISPEPGSDDLSIPPAIDPVRRRLLLASLVERWDRARNGGKATFGFAQAASLARGLAQFIDEADTQSVDLARLESLAAGSLAEHWRQVKEFLAIVRDHWPAVTAAEGSIDPARRRNLVLNALAQRYCDSPPRGRVIVAGTTGSIPATAELLRVVAGLENGAVVLPGLDRHLDDESWEKLDEGHAQFGMKQLLERVGIDRRDVRDWPSAPASGSRATLLRETLRPAPTTDAWRAIAERGNDEIAKGLEGISLVEASHAGEEATSIALILRHALEKRGQTAALVTPDRNLARRVAAELGRWSISIDDSAGRPLVNTPPGTFLSLLAEAAVADFAPVPLLALLKHPLAAGRQEPAQFRRRVRELDRFALRGPRPDRGLSGIAKAIESARKEAKDEGLGAFIASLTPWWRHLESLIRPFADALVLSNIRLGQIAKLHAEAAERLASTHEENGAARLWAVQSGEAASELMAALIEADRDLAPIDPASYSPLFRSFAEERAVRPVYGSHPRLAILGPLEARLQHFDVVVLGGLNEGTWPQQPPADPWLSRPMRKDLGFESPERRIGLAAHDFATLSAGPRVFLTRSLKSEGARSVASRWIERLKQLTKGLGLAWQLDSAEPYPAYASTMEMPLSAPKPEGRPGPCPPVTLRPRSLSVTEIETWLRDPYAIYAKHVLKLRPLEPLDADTGPLERGSAIHLALERFLKLYPGDVPSDALDTLLAIANDVFAEMAIPKSALALWRPRFARAAAWFVATERERRTTIDRSYAEVLGTRTFGAPGGEFVLRGRADRIDVLKRGGAAILDYKTGSPPSSRQVETLLAPQLPLEGAILAEGGFGKIGKLSSAELLYVKLSGGDVPGELRFVKGDANSLVLKSAELLEARVAMFDDESVPYTSRVAPYLSYVAGDYDHLARVQEWSLSGWKEDGE